MAETRELVLDAPGRLVVDDEAEGTPGRAGEWLDVCKVFVDAERDVDDGARAVVGIVEQSRKSQVRTTRTTLWCNANLDADWLDPHHVATI